jgi:Uma2 family endonuclease
MLDARFNAIAGASLESCENSGSSTGLALVKYSHPLFVSLVRSLDMSSDAPAQPPPMLVSEHRPLPVDLHPNIDHIVTEDGAPVDNQFSEKQQRLLAEVLYSSWQPGEPFVAMSNVGLFFAIRTPPFVPDVLVSLGVASPADPFPKKNRSYFVWEYGKPPDLVVEVVSSEEGGEDTVKLQGYAKLGITFYIIYDPEEHLSSKPLRAYRLASGRYELDASESPFFESLGLGVRIWHGVYEDMSQVWLRWTTADGQIMPTGKERAIAEKQRADAEAKRANEAELEATRLKEKLRQLGIE